MNIIENGTRFHMSVSVDGALRHRAFRGFADSDGKPMSKKQAEAHLIILQMKGIKLIRDSDCDNFDPERGCLGHPASPEKAPE